MAISEQKRLFVGNLPPDIKEHEIKSEFSYYGVVDRIELKQKTALNSEEVLNAFAFITIGLDDRTLQQCLREFKQQQFRGRYLQVTEARENFLEKLKREREEAAQNKQKKEESAKEANETVKAVLPTIAADASSSSESSDDESSEDEIAPPHKSHVLAKSSRKSSDSSESEIDEDDLILKKKSKIFLENGKIKIDRTVSSGEAIHVIESKVKKNKKELDEKSKQADEKRLQSLNKMKYSYNQQKLAIKNALAAVDSAQKSNKIVFGDDDDDDDQTQLPKANNKQVPAKPSKEDKKSTKMANLFDDGEDADGDDYEGNFEIKPQFEGKKGEKLRRLQDRFHADSRFKMDSKFLEDDSEGSENEEDSSKQMQKNTDDIETNENDERQWQLNILESVIGKKVKTAKETQKKAPPSMLRFDPTRADHSKFVEPTVKKRKAKVNIKDESESKRMKTEGEYDDVEVEPNAPPVSMNQFYEVRGDLKKSMGGGGFSLLSMFNRSDNADTTTATEKPYEEKLIAKNGVKFLADFDPFKYDSSGDEADDKKHSAQSNADNDTKSLGIKHESFFIFSSADERFAEGLAFFQAPESAENDEANANGYDDAQRQELKNIVKRKIKKSIQNALPRHAKPNKRFKKFAKNL